MGQWTPNDIPDLRGKTAIITGATSGLGFETARALAIRNAHVILACRNLDKGHQAQARIKASLPDASLEVFPLDLASLSAIRHFVVAVQQKHSRLDLLFNNAGLMAIPRQETQDRFEMQFGVNHLGHFALTGLLLPLLLATPASRVITTTSLARIMGRIRFDDLQHQRSYRRWESYGQSKRANLLFSFELQRRLTLAGAQTISVAAHPGAANTNLQGNSVNATGSGALLERLFYATLWQLMSQSAQMGALPQLYAGLFPSLVGGELVGPTSIGHLRGSPAVERQTASEYDQPTAARLWEVSIELTGVDYAPLHISEQPAEPRGKSFPAP